MEDGRMPFLNKLRPYITQCQMYEDPTAQSVARNSVPFDELEENAYVALAKEGTAIVGKPEMEYALLMQLLLWFKGSFRWVNAPACDSCGAETDRVGMTPPAPEEVRFGASRVELYRCRACTKSVRFPRYNNPIKLLETRRGRCGEWANCFTLYCRALGYQSRLALDFTDHIWTECYSTLLGRWVHADPCEGVLDKPLLYEQGWGKKLTYVVAFANNGVYDVTQRYTRKWDEVLTRRNDVSESTVQEILMFLTMEIRADLPSEAWDELAKCDQLEEEEIKASYGNKCQLDETLPGRQSGAKEWRIARGEFGNGVSGSSENPPVVTWCTEQEIINDIRKALGSLWSDVMAAVNSTPKAISCVKGVQAFLVKLKNQPFRTRKVRLDSAEEDAWLPFVSDDTILSLLQALGLQWTLLTDGELWICVDGDPLRAALSLPMALEQLEKLGIVDG